MKKVKNLLILTAVLAALLLVYVLVSPLWSGDGGDTTAAEPEYTVAVIDHNSLVGFELTVKGEEEASTLSFTLNDDATAWLWSENAEIPLDNKVFASVIEALTDATSSHKLEGVSADELAKFGLDDPSYKLSLAFEDGSSKEFIVGKYNSFNSRYYFSDVSAPDTVYMVSAEVTEAMELDIYDFVLLEEPPKITEGKLVGVSFIPGASTDVKSFTFYSAGNDKDYTDNYNWYYSIGNSSAAPLNTDIAKALTSLVTGLSFDECVGFDCTEEKYGFSDSRKITVTYNVDEDKNGVLTEKVYVVYLGDQTESGEIYAHTDSSCLVYLISDADDWVKITNGEQKDFITSELWLPNYERIDQMIFTVGENKIVVNVKNTKGKITFTSEPELDDEELDKLISAMEELKATSHVSALEGNDTIEKKTYFTLEVKFNAGDTAQAVLTVETYTENYCRVSFMGNSERLITTKDAEKLANMIGSAFADTTK